MLAIWRSLHGPALIVLASIYMTVGSTIAMAEVSDELASLSRQVDQLYRARKYSEAIDVAMRALDLAERQFGRDDLNVSAAINDLAKLYRAQGRYAEAEPLSKRALAIDENALGPEHLNVGRDLNGLANLYISQGRYTEAEPLYKRALAIREKALGLDHLDVGQSLNNLAGLYAREERYSEAEPLYKRAIAIHEKALGPDHPNVAADLGFLASQYRAQGRYGEVEPLMKRALAIDEKALGPDHPSVARDLDGLANLYLLLRRYAEAESLNKREIAIAERAYGPDNQLVGAGVRGLALLYKNQGRYAEAEPLMKRALAIREKTLGRDHPLVDLLDVNDLARLYFSQGDWPQAAAYWRRSTASIIRRTQRNALVVGEDLTGKAKGEAERLSWQFWGLVKVGNRLASVQGDNAGLLREMFQIAQWAESSEAAESLTQMAARGAKGDPNLAALVRERQDLVAEWQKRDIGRNAALAQAPEERNATAEAANVGRLAAIDTRIADIDKRLAADFPDYAALAKSTPLSVEEVQTQLGSDEALVLFLDTSGWDPTPEETFIWVVTKTESRWVRSEFGTPALRREVTALRCGLDHEGAWLANNSPCSDVLKVAYSPLDYALRKPLPFDLVRAHDLYKGLFGQIEDLIKGKRLLIIPSGPLTQLPFQVLLTEPPTTARPSSAADYRNHAWLARKHAVTVLPAASSLKALREFAKQSRADESYIGFGNPLLEGEPERFKQDQEAAKLAREKRCDSTLRQRVASLLHLGRIQRTVARSNGGIVDVGDIRRWPPLPETADELCDVARDLGVDPKTHLYLGAMATETRVKQLSEDGSLAKYRIVHFATHGAVAGEISPASEPGLLLTPPERASETDDGYLSASEIAGLKLDADWVMLSACNTAAGEAKSAQALSGLARAFFYAGGRSLLVSHWQVASDSTVKLITKAVDELKRHPKIGRAEALRRAMVSMIDSGKDYEAHPAFWAPFVLVGEGGASR